MGLRPHSGWETRDRLCPAVQEEVGGDEATLNRIHRQTKLLEDRQAEKCRIARLTKDDARGHSLPVHLNKGFAIFSLDPPAIRQDKRNPTDSLDPELLEHLSRHHGEGCTRIRKGSDLF